MVSTEVLLLFVPAIAQQVLVLFKSDLVNGQTRCHFIS